MACHPEFHRDIIDPVGLCLQHTCWSLTCPPLVLTTNSPPLPPPPATCCLMRSLDEQGLAVLCSPAELPVARGLTAQLHCLLGPGFRAGRDSPQQWSALLSSQSMLWPLTPASLGLRLRPEESQTWGQLQTPRPRAGMGWPFHSPWLTYRTGGYPGLDTPRVRRSAPSPLGLLP